MSALVITVIAMGGVRTVVDPIEIDRSHTTVQTATELTRSVRPHLERWTLDTGHWTLDSFKVTK